MPVRCSTVHPPNERSQGGMMPRLCCWPPKPWHNTSHLHRIKAQDHPVSVAPAAQVGVPQPVVVMVVVDVWGKKQSGCPGHVPSCMVECLHTPPDCAYVEAFQPQARQVGLDQRLAVGVLLCVHGYALVTQPLQATNCSSSSSNTTGHCACGCHAVSLAVLLQPHAPSPWCLDTRSRFSSWACLLLLLLLLAPQSCWQPGLVLDQMRCWHDRMATTPCWLSCLSVPTEGRDSRSRHCAEPAKPDAKCSVARKMCSTQRNNSD